MQCPLCTKENKTVFSTANEKIYYACQSCSLVYLDQRFYLSKQEEKERYLKHENNPQNSDYQAFLQPALDSLLPHLKENSCGLDFGCGTGSPLANMFAKHGHAVNGYDPFFMPDQTVFDKTYDFIVSTETFEHLYHPQQELKRLLTCLRRHGYVCVMTQFLTDKSEFEAWYYHRDPSHVLFFNETSFRFLAQSFACTVSFPQKNIALLQGA